MRLDTKVVELYPEFSRSFVGKLCDEKKILVNGKPEKAGYQVKENDKVTLAIDVEALKTVPKINMPILFEDDDVIVINKPAGILTHSKGTFNPEATVASFIADRVNFPTTNEPNTRAGIVHRLDRATSGVIICAKHAQALSWLQKQFSARKAKKTYIAIIDGMLEPKEAIIDMPIARNPKNPKTFYVSPNGKPAQTHYRIIDSDEKYCTILLQPTTGRTHQLRVHLAYLGHPIVGDTLYKGETNDRMLLHAQKLEIRLPSGDRKEFIAQIPEDFHTYNNEYGAV